MSCSNAAKLPCRKQKVIVLYPDIIIGLGDSCYDLAELAFDLSISLPVSRIELATFGEIVEKRL